MFGLFLWLTRLFTQPSFYYYCCWFSVRYLYSVLGTPPTLRPTSTSRSNIATSPAIAARATLVFTAWYSSVPASTVALTMRGARRLAGIVCLALQLAFPFSLDVLGALTNRLFLNTTRTTAARQRCTGLILSSVYDVKQPNTSAVSNTRRHCNG